MQNLTKTAAALSPSSLPSLFETMTSDARYTQLAYHLLIYAPLVAVVLPRYLSSQGPRLVRRFNHTYAPLLFHIFASLAIVVRHQYRILATPAHLFPHAGPVATQVDLALGLANAAAGWGLTRKNGKGNPRMARAGFQSFALHVAMCSIVAYVTGSPDWLDAMVKDHNAFAHVRFFLIADKLVPGGMLGKYGEGYTLALFTGLLMATAEGRTPAGWGMPAYLLGIMGIVLLEMWISGKITPKNAKTNPLVKLVLFLGLVEYSTYKMLSSADADNAIEAKAKASGGVKTD